MKSKAKIWSAMAGVMAVVLLEGCNIYEPFYSKRASSLDYNGLIIRGTDALNRGDYDEAEYYYAKAKLKNYKGSVGYLFHAQAVVLQYGLDFTYLKNEFDSKRGTGAAGVPFVGPTTTIQQINDIYFPVYTAVLDAEHILRQRGDTICVDDPKPATMAACKFKLLPDGDTASDGHVGQGVARLDLGLLQAIKGMLAPLDMDQNGRINDSCGYNICTNGDSTSANCTVTLKAKLKRRCRDGVLSERYRFANFKKLTENVHMDNLDSKDVNARYMSTNPNDINDFIASMVEPIARSVYNLDSVETALNSHSDSNLTKNISGVVSNVRDLGNFLSYMGYNDSVDNDFDSNHVVPGSPVMLWHDYDRDHGVRFDNRDNSNLDPNVETGNIGHPIHRFRHKVFYYTYNQLASRDSIYARMRADNSVNSRFNLMRKKCRDKINNLTSPLTVNPTLDQMTGTCTADSVLFPRPFYNPADTICICDSVSSVLQAWVPTPARGFSDWIGGPTGVDEEMIDEFDNDYDGLKDEDGRNMKGFDDDDDADMSSGLRRILIGNNPVAMQWADDATHKNKCPDWDVTLPMNRDPLTTDSSVNYHLLRQNCIGSLENRFWMYKAYGSNASAEDSLRKYYSEVGDGTPGTQNDTNKNCMDEWRRMLNVTYQAGYTTAAAALRVCHFKHIWNANRPIPPRSEWTDGNYGIDEEKVDGVDNDGDGWIDEDVDFPFPSGR